MSAPMPHHRLLSVILGLHCSGQKVSSCQINKLIVLCSTCI